MGSGSGKRGGARPGSGRKPGKVSLEKEQARALVRELVTRELEPMVKAQIDHAKGLKYLVVRQKSTGKFVRVDEGFDRMKLGSDEEKVEIWLKDPSIQAFTDLANRVLDKPAEQTIELDVNLRGDLLSRLIAGRKRVAEARK